MTTKQELINEIDNLVSKYLGFKTSCYGLKSKSKQELQILVHNMQRAVLYKSLADDYKPTTSETLLYALSGEYTAQYKLWVYLIEAAHRLYFNEIEIVAAEEAYHKVYDEM